MQSSHYDNMGNVDMITDARGVTVEKYKYTPYGKRTVILSNEQRDESRFTNRGFTGHEHIEEFNLIHMNGRLYDPELKRFLSPDPYMQNTYNPQNLNRYSYVMNSPFRYTDPSGYFFEEIFGFLTGGDETAMAFGDNIDTAFITAASWGETSFEDTLDFEAGFTTFAGVQGSASAGVSGATATGGFWALNYDSGELTYTSGYYWNIEGGAGTPAPAGGVEVGVMLSGDVEGTFAGSYLNNGGSGMILPLLSGGVDITSTVINPKTNESTTAISFNGSLGFGPPVEGHSRIGKTNILIFGKFSVFKFKLK